MILKINRNYYNYKHLLKGFIRFAPIGHKRYTFEFKSKIFTDIE